jgi:hypothetical protein
VGGFLFSRRIVVITFEPAPLRVMGAHYLYTVL